MPARKLSGLLSQAPDVLCTMLESGPLLAPIRAEIFGPLRFAQHGRSLGQTHRAALPLSRTATFSPRLRSNIQSLRQAHHYLGERELSGDEINPAAVWLLENYPLIEAQFKEVEEGLPGRFFYSLPVLLDEPLAGLPRIFGVAWAFVAHTDSAFSEELLIQFLTAYQETRELSLGEMWALPTTLRVVLIENLRRLSEAIAVQQAARDAANLCAQAIESFSIEALEALRSIMQTRSVGNMFLMQLAQRLQARGTRGHTLPAIYREWLGGTFTNLSELESAHRAAQAADNLSVSNAVTALRAIGTADWPGIVARSSVLMCRMLTCPLFASESIGTRDQTLHSIEQLAKRYHLSEVQIADALLRLMQQDTPRHPEHSVADNWLNGPGQRVLLQALGQTRHARVDWHMLGRRIALPLYLGLLLLGTIALTAWLLSTHHQPGNGTSMLTGWGLLAAWLALFPASEAVVTIVNRLITESVPPEYLPRLALQDGIPPAHRVIVVIPAMLTQTGDAHALAHRLQLHYLANPETQAQFALLTDWADADAAQSEQDRSLLDEAVAQIQALNTRYPHPDDQADAAPRFILLHRARRFNETEQRWLGWERKRGKIEQLAVALNQGLSHDFLNLGRTSRLASDIRYILTLDSDTQLPAGRLRELVGVAAHPQNQPKLSADGRSVVSGYGIFQPRLVTPLPSPEDFTLFHWLFAGQNGIDPYCIASSEVYQDLFAEGTFTGKGLINVSAMQAVLSGRLPENQVLSHDLLEGALLRCAAVSDITVIEDAPFHADVAASRIHRWTRGDWQLMPYLLAPRHNRLRAINCWKIFDNLRRSLVAPMSMGLLLLSLSGRTISPWAALSLILTAFCAGPLMGAIAGLFPRRRHVAKLLFYRQASVDLLRTLLGSVWHLVQLLQQSLLSLDAIARTLYRMGISRRHLLQWTSAATAQMQARTDLSGLVRQHWKVPACALLLALISLAVGTPYALLVLALCLLWGASPVWIWLVSRRHSLQAKPDLSPDEQAYLSGIARDTWRFFERCVVAEEHHLPADNLQTTPNEVVAHRTSPTNIGIYLLSVTCAREFGWIGVQELLMRLSATLATLAMLERHRGHFLNWYDTRTCAPLLPNYISTVDSGNLSGHLLAVAQACRAFSVQPDDPALSQRGLQACRTRLAPLLKSWPALAPQLVGDCALARLLALTEPLDSSPDHHQQTGQLLQAAQAELAAWSTRTNQPGSSAAQDLVWGLEDLLSTLRSAWTDADTVLNRHTTRELAQAITASRLSEIAQTCEQLAWSADFSFLYHPKRHLLHIGFRVAEQQLDTGFYDLLASESRLTSLLAIAKADVPVHHWNTLGRPFFASRAHPGLRSWSGSMFEYLMPALILKEPVASVLYEASHVALREQMEFAQNLGVPWGISESAYAARDQELTYQYAPHGIARLALRRTPAHELVIAPYATALAAQISPRQACQNFMALEALGARTRYGFVDAVDFSPNEREQQERFVLVDTFMAHHQGMSIVALSNVLHDGCAQHWGMDTPKIEAVISLLHERAPREVSATEMPDMTAPAHPRRRPPVTGEVRQLSADSSDLEPTHLLSNGRYHVRLRANGAGASHWRQTDITRWRDDALRDAYGSFFYVRTVALGQDMERAVPVSITQHPAYDPQARYYCEFQTDRVCFSAIWPDLQVHSTVLVSPEDDIELRKIELCNLSDRTMDIELISAFEVSLSPPAADESHPAFTNLFIQACWEDAYQALVFERKPRLAAEPNLFCAHFLTNQDADIVSIRYQTDRQRWLGRNQRISQPRAQFEALPARNAHTGTRLDTGLDPVCALAVRLHIAPHAKAQLTFATALSEDPEALHSVMDKYRQPSSVQRASLLSATLASMRTCALGLSAENFSAIQILTTTLIFTLSRPASQAVLPEHMPMAQTARTCDRRLLWRFGISGVRPVILVNAESAHSISMLRVLVQAMNLWAWGGVACDLVVVSDEQSLYPMTQQREISELRDQFLKSCESLPSVLVTHFHLLRALDLSGDELNTLQNLACVWLHPDERPLSQHVRQLAAFYNGAGLRRQATVPVGVATSRRVRHTTTRPTGQFEVNTGAFNFAVSSGKRPLRPWINVLSNPHFGAQVSETAAGYTWAVNSRLNQLTAWSNDPVSDPPAEWFILQDLHTGDAWSVSPNAWSDAHAQYAVTHGQGYTRIEHRRGDLSITAQWCVDPLTSVKQITLNITNHGHQTAELRLTGCIEWIMGEQRRDRSTTFTSASHRHLPGSEVCLADPTQRHTGLLTILLCTQLNQSAGFGGGSAFFTLCRQADDAQDWTCDRREFFNTCGEFVLPTQLAMRQGAGLDPCAAISTHCVLAKNASTSRSFMLGYGDSPERAKALAVAAASTQPEQRVQHVRDKWDQLLGAAQVTTPDPLFNVMVNRWLLYQTVSCRMWAKSGFYQAGGATGFRDQLQDAMALAWSAPDMLRQQLLLAASRQFIEGDVQHWWHAPNGTGVRTRISDDLLWLPYACVHYLRTTGDTSLLDVSVPFIEGVTIDAGADDAYATPTTSREHASVYEHAARTIDHSLRCGVHGLPLMGDGDWNDGLNRIGHGGLGESVWLGWFVCQLIADFAPIAQSRGDATRALRWLLTARNYKQALNTTAWDGQWFKRAFFDNGTPFGTRANQQAQIDLTSQAWAVLSKVATPDRQHQALAAMEQRLVDPEAGLIMLLTPPLTDAMPHAGYTQSYPPGVRENGSQYSHAGVWALMAQAQACQTLPLNQAQDAADTVYRYFTYLSPAHRAAHPKHGLVYGTEPYVIAGDVYSQPPYTGRGGWSWYTGSAAWLHRAALESMFGLRQGPTTLSFHPCLPCVWSRAELTLKRDGRSMRFIFLRQTPAATQAVCETCDATLLAVGQALEWQVLPAQSCFVIALEMRAAPASQPTGQAEYG